MCPGYRLKSSSRPVYYEFGNPFNKLILAAGRSCIQAFRCCLKCMYGGFEWLFGLGLSA